MSISAVLYFPSKDKIKEDLNRGPIAAIAPYTVNQKQIEIIVDLASGAFAYQRILSSALQKKTHEVIFQWYDDGPEAKAISMNIAALLQRCGVKK